MLDPCKPQQLNVLQIVRRRKRQIQSQTTGFRVHRYQY